MRLSLQILRLQAEAFRRHGLTRDQFLSITPRELGELNADAFAEWETEKTIEDKRTARLIAAIYNASPNRKRGKTFTEKDFLPQQKKTAQPAGNSAENLLAKVKWFHAAIHADAKKQKPNGR